MGHFLRTVLLPRSVRPVQDPQWPMTCFFGAIIDQRKVWPYVPPPEGSRLLNLKQVAFPPDVRASGKRASLLIKSGEGDAICLGTLVCGRTDFMAVDILLDGYAELSVVGECPLHVSGYFVPDENSDEMDAALDEDDESIEDEEEAVEKEGLVQQNEKKLAPWEQMLLSAIADEDDEEEDPDFDIDAEDEDEDAEEDETQGGSDDEYELATLGDSNAGNAQETTAADTGTAQRSTGHGTKRSAPHEPNSPAAKRPANGVDGKGQEPQKDRQKHGKKDSQRKKGKEDLVAPGSVASSTKKGNVVVYPNGLKIEKLVLGTGGKVAKGGKRVVVKYVGKLGSGKTFDKTKGNSTFSFRLGCGEVIQGWDKGIMNMHVGDKRRITVPPSMAYGSQGVPGAIPPNATLTFDVELVDVK